jgi:hypothetical protein
MGDFPPAEQIRIAMVGWGGVRFSDRPTSSFSLSFAKDIILVARQVGYFSIVLLQLALSSFGALFVQVGSSALTLQYLHQNFVTDYAPTIIGAFLIHGEAEKASLCFPDHCCFDLYRRVPKDHGD